MVLLWKLPGLKLCLSILDHLKEDVMKIQRQERFPNFRKDQEHIASLQGKLNAFVSMFHICQCSLLSHSFDYSAQLPGLFQH